MSPLYAPYSVLLSVYEKDNPEHLREAISSMVRQTVPPDDFLIVCDGPLTEALDRVIVEAAAVTETVRCLRIPTNQGLGRALARGLVACEHDLVARMDADDIAVPERAEIQLALFQADPKLDVTSGVVSEFRDKPRDIRQFRSLPEQHDEIVRFARVRNPINHPCVMYRRESVLEAGNYQDFFRLEDYFLWVRMIRNGARFSNSPEVLLQMRVGNGAYKRRAGLKYARSQVRLLRFMRSSAQISRADFLRGVALRVPLALVPDRARSFAFERLIRDQR